MKTFNVKHDFINLSSWMQKRGLAIPDPRHLPPTGVIVDNAACGFLVKCDNNSAIIDFLISNPDIPDEQRAEAIDEVMTTLIDTAKRAGIHSLYGHVQLESSFKIAMRHGFSHIGDFKALLRGL